MFRTLQNILPANSNGTWKTPLCDIDELTNIHPTGSMSTLSSVTSKTSVKQQRPHMNNSCNNTQPITTQNIIEEPTDESHNVDNNSPLPTELSAIVLNSQQLNTPLSSSSSESGVCLLYN